MNKEDYSKYYIQGSEHYLIPKDIFDELFDEMESWKEDTQKYKEVIDNALSILRNELYKSRCRCDACNDYFIENLIKLLEQKEVE